MSREPADPDEMPRATEDAGPAIPRSHAPPEPVPPPSKPLAAYRLGYLPRMARLWEKFFWYGQAYDGGRPCDDSPYDLELALDQLDEAVRSLDGVLIPGAVPALTKEVEAYRCRARYLADTPGGSVCLRGVPPLTGEQEWRALMDLADRALAEPSGLGVWQGLGAALGAARLYGNDVTLTRRWSYLRLPSSGPEDLPREYDMLPRLMDLDAAARIVPPPFMAQLPILSDLRRRIPSRDEPDASAALLRRLKAPWFDTEGPYEYEDHLVFLNRLMWRLDAEIQGVAARLGPERAAKPYWDPKAGSLWFGGEVVRTVASQARNVRLILDSFTELGWIGRIPDPLPESGGMPKSNRARRNTAKKHREDTARQLNEGLRVIRFGTVEDGFTWQPADPGLENSGRTPGS